MKDTQRICIKSCYVRDKKISAYARKKIVRNPLQCSELHSELPAKKYRRKCIYKLHTIEHELHLLPLVGIKPTAPKRTDILSAASINQQQGLKKLEFVCKLENMLAVYKQAVSFQAAFAKHST